MQARLANLGYLAVKKQSDKNVGVTPNVYIPLYSESLNTMVNLDEDSPIAGQKNKIFQFVQGQRSHKGEVQVIAEPHTIGYLIDMLLKKGSTTGSNPYTHPFTLSSSDPNAYTFDIAKGQVVHRFIGVEINEFGHEYDENKMLLNLTVSARKSFIAREVASLSSDTLTLKTNYDSVPTDGLVVGDIMRLFKADGSTVDLTIQSIDSDNEVTFTGTPTGAADGDILCLRPATPSFSTLTPFMWARTKFHFGPTASDALSADPTPLEKGSEVKIMHNFEEDEGSKLSGSFDPADLVRTDGEAEVSVKIKFDTPEDMNKFLTVQKRALVIRFYSGTSYELRVTLNNLRFTEDPVELKTGEILYAEGTLKAAYDTSDAQAFDVKVINDVATI